MTAKKEKTEEQKKEVPVTPEVTEQVNEQGEQSVKAEVKHGPRDYLVKAAELLKECGDTRNIKVAQNAIEEALLFIGNEGL